MIKSLEVESQCQIEHVSAINTHKGPFNFFFFEYLGLGGEQSNSYAPGVSADDGTIHDANQDPNQRAFFPVQPYQSQEGPLEATPVNQLQDAPSLPGHHERGQAFVPWSQPSGEADFKSAQVGSSDDDATGSGYRFSYDAGDHSRTESRDPNGGGVVSGSYSFVADDGVQRSVRYTAGAGTGFVAEGDHLPQPPELPTEHMEQLRFLADHHQQQLQQHQQLQQRSLGGNSGSTDHWERFVECS